MNKRIKLSIAILLAFLLVAGVATTASARAVSVWVGQWQSMDIPGDGSTNTLNIAFRGNAHTYNLVWRETYFSLCGGQPGVGRGTGVEVGFTLEASMDFYCRGTFAGHFDLVFTYDPATDTFSDGSYEWRRTSPRPW